MIYVKKLGEGAYFASFESKDAPADYRSLTYLTAADVIAELSRRGADPSAIEEALEIADREWSSQTPPK